MPTTPQLSAITVAADGSAFGVDAQGRLYAQVESLPTDAGDWQLTTWGVPLARVSATSGQDVWGITAQHAVYRFQGLAFASNQVSGAQLDRVGAAADGTV
jgi:hypothetical protein